MWIKTPSGYVINTERVTLLVWDAGNLMVNLDGVALRIEEDIPEKERGKVLDKWMRLICPSWNGTEGGRMLVTSIIPPTFGAPSIQIPSEKTNYPSITTTTISHLEAGNDA